MVYLIQAKKYERAAKRKLLKYHGIHIALKKIDKCLVGCTLTLNMVGTNDVINKLGDWKKWKKKIQKIMVFESTVPIEWDQDTT